MIHGGMIASVLAAANTTIGGMPSAPIGETPVNAGGSVCYSPPSVRMMANKSSFEANRKTALMPGAAIGSITCHSTFSRLQPFNLAASLRSRCRTALNACPTSTVSLVAPNMTGYMLL